MKVDPNEVTARDLMQSDVFQLQELTSIEGAVETFEELHITGAPVVNQVGEPVGVLTASDIIRSDRIEEGRLASHASSYCGSEVATGEEPLELSEEYSTATTGRRTVGDWMHPGLVSVRPEATLGEICALMERESIHRVFVVEDGRLLGIVSGVDIVNHIARAAVGS